MLPRVRAVFSFLFAAVGCAEQCDRLETEAGKLREELLRVKAQLRSANFRAIRQLSGSAWPKAKEETPSQSAVWQGVSLLDWAALPRKTQYALASDGKALVTRGDYHFTRLNASYVSTPDGGTGVAQVGGGLRIFQLLTYRSGRPVWSKTLLSASMATPVLELSPEQYPGSAPDVLLGLQQFAPAHALSYAVFSSISPWVEVTILKHQPAASIRTVDFNPPIVEPGMQISSVWHSDLPGLLERSAEEPFDVIVSFSGIEHDGLGRYGDPVHPNGDLAAMKEMWSCLKPGGLLLLAVPTCSHDLLVFPEHRIYGPHRLKRVLRGFNLVGRVRSSQVVRGGWETAKTNPGLLTLPHPSTGSTRRCHWSNQPLLALKRREAFDE